MVSVICQCRNSWMHESPDVSPSSSFNPCRGPMLQLLQARPRGFHFDFPSIPSQGRKGRRSLSKVQIALVRKDFVPFFLIFLRRRYRSNVINTRFNPPPPWMQSSIALRPRKGNLPFFPSCINSRTRCFTLHRISSPSPIRFLLASIPERDRLDDLPSMWKQKRKSIDSFEETSRNVLREERERKKT